MEINILNSSSYFKNINFCDIIEELRIIISICATCFPKCLCSFYSLGLSEHKVRSTPSLLFPIYKRGSHGSRSALSFLARAGTFHDGPLHSNCLVSRSDPGVQYLSVNTTVELLQWQPWWVAPAWSTAGFSAVGIYHLDGSLFIGGPSGIWRLSQQLIKQVFNFIAGSGLGVDHFLRIISWKPSFGISEVYPTLIFHAPRKMSESQ